MPPFISFDVETTGLPRNRRCGFRNLEAFDSCRLVSLAIVEFDEEHKECGHLSYIVKPDGYTVSATEIHGITHERAEAEGRPFEELYEELCYMFTQIPTVVGHNIEFDLNVISSEAWRRGLSIDIFESVKAVCTLKMTRELFCEPRKLGVLYRDLFGRELTGAHDALPDARAAGEIYALYCERDPRVYKPLGVKTVWLKASDIGAMIGLSSFKKPREVIDNIWAKYSPDTFRGKTTEQEQIQALEIAPSVIREVYSNVVTFTGSSSELQDTYEKARDAINSNPDMSQSQKSLVTDHLRKTMYTNHGIYKESETAETLGELREDHTFYKISVCRIEDTEYVLCGRVDRVETLPGGATRLVEIKNRTRGLFRKVRDYENAQVQAYLQMNRTWARARLVEQYNNEKLSYDIERDDIMWSTMVSKLTEFCKAAHHYMSS